MSEDRYRNRNRDRISEMLKPETKDTSKPSTRFADKKLVRYIAACLLGKYSAWVELSLAQFASDEIQVQNGKTSPDDEVYLRKQCHESLGFVSSGVQSSINTFSVDCIHELCTFSASSSHLVSYSSP